MTAAVAIPLLLETLGSMAELGVQGNTARQEVSLLGKIFCIFSYGELDIVFAPWWPQRPNRLFFSAGAGKILCSWKKIRGEGIRPHQLRWRVIGMGCVSTWELEARGWKAEDFVLWNLAYGAYKRAGLNGFLDEWSWVKRDKGEENPRWVGEDGKGYTAVANQLPSGGSFPDDGGMMIVGHHVRYTFLYFVTPQDVLSPCTHSTDF